MMSHTACLKSPDWPVTMYFRLGGDIWTFFWMLSSETQRTMCMGMVMFFQKLEKDIGSSQGLSEIPWLNSGLLEAMYSGI